MLFLVLFFVNDPVFSKFPERLLPKADVPRDFKMGLFNDQIAALVKLII